MRAVCLLLGLTVLVRAGIADLREPFREPPAEAKIMMRWWWFGPAVTHSGLEREMRTMKAGGIGGFEVQPVYPLALDDPAKGIRNLPYLEPKFLDAVRFTAQRARELGLRMDMTMGSGWPYGGPHITPDLASARFRMERRNVPQDLAPMAIPVMKDGGLIAAFVARGNDWIQLRREADRVVLPASTQPGTEVLFFFTGRTGQQVKRAAVGAEGPVLDHLNRAAIAKHIAEVGEKLLAAAGPGNIHAFFCDSLEVYGANWTHDLLDEFRKRRGYDLLLRMPLLIADNDPRSAGVRHDFSRTVSELATERFIVPLHDWCRRHGALLRMQDYGTPPVTLASQEFVDLPEGEGARWDGFSASRWASSASHAYGRKVTSAETWTWLHSPVFRATPLDMKQEADQHFLMGINQIVGHGWPYTPESVGRPGWSLYAAGVFHDRNPWWSVMPDVSRYLARVSFMLRQGAPANDIAVYLPVDDAWAAMLPTRMSINETVARRIGSRLIPQLLASGYNFDFIDDGILASPARIENGRITFGDHSYRVVVLPGVVRMPEETKIQLRKFVSGGGVLVATGHVPDGVEAILAEEDATVSKLLQSRLMPDMVLTPAAPQVGFIRRSLPDGEIYFIANTGNTEVRTRAAFRVRGLNTEWWNPMTGETQPAAVAARSGEQTALDLEIEPYGSRLLVFSKSASRTARRAPDPAVTPLDLGSGWEVTFQDSGTKAVMDTLHSWADDPATRYYSGIAIYRKSVTVPGAFSAKGARVVLRFGEGVPQEIAGNRSGARLAAPVREAAVVYVNGRRATSVWAPPYEADVSGLLRRGANDLRIEVANTEMNQMAGAPPLDYSALIPRYGRRFDMQDLNLVEALPSGLLGPIQLVIR
ncbi:MAG: glycoside hydrolase [Acidobacteriales bacterium]|nr:glycoside hydrolase [Terriglobales bacterium]